VFADDVSVTALWRDVQALADLKAEPTRVEHRPTADHSVIRQAAQLPSHVRQYVHYTYTRNIVIMLNSHRPPDTTRRSCLCRVWRCELSRPDRPTSTFCVGVRPAVASAVPAPPDTLRR